MGLIHVFMYFILAAGRRVDLTHFGNGSTHFGA